MFRKLKYYVQIFPLIKYVSNWYQIIFLYLFPGREVVLKLRNGIKFTITHHLDALTVKEIFLDKDYEIPIKNTKTIIDIGANIGTYSLFAAKKFPHSNIYAYEPEKSTFRVLKKNLEENGVKNVKSFRLGVSSKPGFRYFYTYQASGFTSLLPTRKDGKRQKVKVTTLLKIFKDNLIKTCGLIKMDCEGAEYEILLNCPDSLFKRIKAFVLEYHDGLSEHKSTELVNLLSQKAYKVRVRKHPLEDDIGIIYAKK